MNRIVLIGGVWESKPFLGPAFGKRVVEEGVRAKDSDVNVAVFADIRIASIGALSKDGNTTGAELIACLDCVADR